MESRDYLICVKYARKILRNEMNLEFMKKCQFEKILPQFTRLKSEIIQKADLSKNKVRTLRFKKLKETIQSQEKILNQSKKHFDTQFSKYSHLNLANITTEKTENNDFFKKTMFEKAHNLEKNNKFRKITKFEKLKKIQKPPNQIERVKIKIFNETNKVIPDNVMDALSDGFEFATGGLPNKIKVLTSFDYFFEKWRNYSRKIGLDEFQILEIRAKLFVLFSDLVKYKFNSPKRTILNKFFEQNENILIVPSDKNKSVTLTDKEKYISKLKEVLDGNEFEKLESDPLEDTSESLKESLLSFEKYLDAKTLYKMKPKSKNKRMYGTYKTHKTNVPIRPIISSLHTVCSGSEEVLLSILNKFKYDSRSIYNSKQFKAAFLQIQNKFDHNKHDILSFDAVSLFTRVDTEAVVNYVCEKIYRSPVKYFKSICQKNDRNRYKIPPVGIFKTFFNNILTKFSCFDSHCGYYRQTKGISMGSKISSFLANVFCHMMESEKILPYEKNGKILKYVRYVDDVFICCDKKYTDEILRNMNNYHDQLVFTKQNIENNSLQFLECSIYIDENNVPQFRSYYKEGSELTVDYKYSISPNNQKISVLCGEIYRCNDNNSNDADLKKSLDYVRLKYRNLNYPEGLVNGKIAEIKNRNFKPKTDKAEKLAERLANPDSHCNLKLTFTHPNCEKVGKRIYNLIRSVTPDFRLNIIWNTIKLSQTLSPKLKAQIVDLEKNNLVYSFQCICDLVYFGETKRRLKDRAVEHQQPGRKTAVSKHIITCDMYMSELKNIAGDKPTPNQRIDFCLNRFKPIATNLPYTDERKRYEAIAIKIYNPLLNKQIERKAVSII